MESIGFGNIMSGKATVYLSYQMVDGGSMEIDSGDGVCTVISRSIPGMLHPITRVISSPGDNHFQVIQKRFT